MCSVKYMKGGEFQQEIKICEEEPNVKSRTEKSVPEINH